MRVAVLLDNGGLQLKMRIADHDKKKSNTSLARHETKERKTPRTLPMSVELDPSIYSRMSETNFVIGDDLAAELGSDFTSILNNLSDDPSLGLIKSQLQTLQSCPVVAKALPSHKQAAAERELNYKASIKDARKWIPQLRRNVESEQLQFGEISADIKQTTSSLSEHFQPTNDFEIEMQKENICCVGHQAIAESGVTEVRVAAAKALPVAPNINQQRVNSHVAQLKAILFREQQKNRRINKIKSKMWRKVNRKSELMEREHLLGRLEKESPEIAAKIRTEMEAKRAGMRMLKRQNARRKWAQVAMRFGGKEIQKVISREAQNAKDDMDALTRIVKSSPGETCNSDSDESDRDLDFNSDDGGDTVTSVLEKAKLMIEKEVERDDGGADPKKRRKGLMGLKFMQQAVEREKQKNQENANIMLTEIENLRESVKRKLPKSGDVYDDDLDSGDEQVEESIIKKRKMNNETVKKLPKISKEELQKASEELGELAPGGESLRNMSKASVCVAGNIDVAVNVKKREGIMQRGKEEHTENRTGEKIEKLDANCQEEKESPRAKIRNKKEKNSVNGEPEIASAISDLVTTLASEGVLQSAIEQEALVKEAFVIGDQGEEAQKAMEVLMIEDENESKEKENNKLKLAGWGSWTGDGIRKRKIDVDNEVKPIENKAKPKIYINRKLDRKLASYFVKSVPFPYSNKEQFEAANSHPLGPEWNTMQVHKRFVQPEVAVRAGTVIMPLEYAKRLPKDQADSLLDVWSERGKKRAPKARL